MDTQTIMRRIEERINPHWSQIQKARFIYLELGKEIQPSENGFEESQLLKVMCERQGILCDCIRGTYKDVEGWEQQGHYWNVITTTDDGQNHYAVDLSNDVRSIQNGLGTHFFAHHITNTEMFYVPDNDQKQYERMRGYRSMQELDQNILPLSLEEKLQCFKDAIGEIYNETNREKGPVEAEEAARAYTYSFITGEKQEVSKGSAREKLSLHVKPEELLDMVVSSYVNQLKEKPSQQDLKGRKDVLDYAITKTANKYGKDQAIGAIKKNILFQNNDMFTGDGNARDLLSQNVEENFVVKMVVAAFVNQELEIIKIKQKNRMNDAEEKDLTREEYQKFIETGDIAKSTAMVKPEEPKWKRLIHDAIHFIKEHTKEWGNHIKGKIQEARNQEDER